MSANLTGKTQYCNLPNCITVLRMAGTLCLLFLRPLSTGFFVFYTLSGLTDVLVSSAKAGGIIGTGSVSALEVRSCRNSGSVRGYAVSGGILGEASPVQGAEAASLLVQSCTNSGSIYTVFPGGLTQEIYAGGIVGCCPIALPDENLLPLFDDLRIENCENTGKLDGDREPDILCTDDLCGSWQSRLS